MKKSRKKSLIIFIVLIGIIVLFSNPILTAMGNFLVKETENLQTADAVVVLTTGVDYTARLIEAARIYEKGLAKKIVIDGDRKSDILKQLETQGYQEACHWSENPISVLKFFDVSESNIIVLDAPDAYDTVSEAAITGGFLRKYNLTKLIITTSKYHTRRAGYIWKTAYDGIFDIQVAAARDDPFREDAWWKDGRQVRQLLSEYGAWFYYWIKSRKMSDGSHITDGQPW